MRYLSLALITILIISSLTFTNGGNMARAIPDKLKNYLLELARDTWNCFVRYTCNWTGLPYDRSTPGNPQTSITNMGLYLASIVAAYDLGFIDRDEALSRAKKTVETLLKLEKWHGIPFNWYNAETLSPIWGNFVSSVDAGWYAAGLIVARNAFPELYENITKLLDMMEWDKLYDSSAKLLYIGYDSIGKHYTSAHYDYLAIESRMASLIGIGSGKIPAEHWFALKRDMQFYRNISFLWGWKAGLFIYYMPGIFVDERGSFICRSTINVTIAQMTFANDQGYPVWGFSPCDIPEGGYGMNFAVATPHASVLALLYFPERVFLNLLMLEEMGVREDLGFKDSVNLVSGIVDEDYLALDQGMILLTIANYLNSSIWKYFMKDPIVTNALSLIGEYDVSEEVLEAYRFVFENATEAVLELIAEEIIPVSAMDRLLKAKLMFGCGRYDLAVKYANESIALAKELNLSECISFVQDSINKAAEAISRARQDNRVTLIDKADELYNEAVQLFNENKYVSSYVKARIAKFYADISRRPAVKRETSLTLSTAKPEFRYPENVTLSGSIDPPIKVDILIERKVGNLWKGVEVVSTDSSGRFTFSIRLDPGNYSFRACFFGSERYKPSISNIVNVAVLKGLREINISGVEDRVKLGIKVNISGYVKPSEELQNVILKIIDPANMAVEKILEIDEKGNFRYSIEVNKKGNWTVIVEVPETDRYLGGRLEIKFEAFEEEKGGIDIQTIILSLLLVIALILVFKLGKRK